MHLYLYLYLYVYLYLYLHLWIQYQQMMPGFGTPLANQWFWLRHVWEARWRDHPLQGGLIICKHMMDSNGLWTLRWSTLQPLKQLTNGWVLSSMSSSIQLVLIIREYESVDHLLLKITTLSTYWKSPGYQLGRMLVHLSKTWKHHSGSSGSPTPAHPQLHCQSAWILPIEHLKYHQA